MVDYQAIFNKVESTLVRIGDQDARQEDMRHGLYAFRNAATKTFTDADYFSIMVHVAFYSGFKATTVDAKRPTIDKYFSDYKTVAGYGAHEVNIMLADRAMIKHRGKIEACIDNARAFANVVNQHGSFQNYIDSFSPRILFSAPTYLRRSLVAIALAC